MRRQSVLRTIRMKLPGVAAVCGLLLVAGFLTGGFAAFAYSGSWNSDSCLVLREYLFDYCTMCEHSGGAASFLDCIRLYLGGIFLVFLLGFSSLGVVLTPLLSFSLGFTSFYTVLCFTITFGRSGILIAASLIAVRLFFTVPCFFVMASKSWCFSYRLASAMVGQGKRVERIHYSGSYFLIFFVCLVVLCVGICCERLFTPYLFRTVMGRIDFNF